MARWSKHALKSELGQLLQAGLEALERAHQATREAATHEEAKPENDKDTRALEQSYLARGQAKRVEELAANLVELQSMRLRDWNADDPVALGAVITVEEDGEGRTYFMAPQGGGSTLAEGAVVVVTPKSPLGRALLGKRAGDECELVVSGKRRELVVVGIE